MTVTPRHLVIIAVSALAGGYGCTSPSGNLSREAAELEQQAGSEGSSHEGADPTPVAGSPIPRKPNVIVFFTDDHGFSDLGVQSFDGLTQTPFTDELARAGVLFSSGFVTAPQCAPSRAGLLTGVYQGVFGMENNKQGPLPLGRDTLADYLRAAGYRTGMAGKWHLDVDQNNRDNLPADTDESLYKPGNRGFDEYFEGTRNQYWATHHANGVLVQDAPRWVADQQFRIDAATEWSRNFIRRHSNEPFFLYVPYFAPHVPLEAPDEDLAVFPGDIEQKRRTALAMIHAMDRGVGGIVEELQSQGLSDETVIFYAGDNGAPVIPHLDNGSRNTPLLGEKGMLTDGGIRVPFFISWPGQLHPGNYPYMVSTVDIVPTVLRLAGAEVPAGLSGENIWPAITNEIYQPVRAALHWRFLTQAAIRTEEWKAIVLSDGTEFLFDLRGQGLETVNVRSEFPDVFEALLRSLSEWSQSLEPPGLPQGALHPGDRQFYQYHELIGGS